MRLALYALSLLPIPALAVLALAMYRRKQHILYPAFWAYIVLQCLRLVIEFICNLISYKAYFYAYWTCSFLSAILTLVLLRTLFVSFLEKYPALDTIRRHGFEFVVSILWFTALALNLGLMRDQAWPQRITRAELVLSFTEVGVFLFVLATTLTLGIKWRSTYCGIAAGLGLLGAENYARRIGPQLHRSGCFSLCTCHDPDLRNQVEVHVLWNRSRPWPARSCRFAGVYRYVVGNTFLSAKRARGLD